MSYSYLGSPYTGSPEIMEERYEAAMQATGWLLRQRIWVYSPIVHCHEIAKRFNLPRGAAEFWGEYNDAMMAEASKFIILTLKGWEDSVGLKDEIGMALKYRVNIEFLDPKVLK